MRNDMQWAKATKRCTARYKSEVEKNKKIIILTHVEASATQHSVVFEGEQIVFRRI